MSLAEPLPSGNWIKHQLRFKLHNSMRTAVYRDSVHWGYCKGNIQ